MLLSFSPAVISYCSSNDCSFSSSTPHSSKRRFTSDLVRTTGSGSSFCDSITAGEKSSLVASNITNTKRFDIKTPDVVVHVDPERADLVETRVIDGRKCLVIPMEGEVELNGIRVHTGNENPSDDEFYDNTDTETEETSDGE